MRSAPDHTHFVKYRAKGTRKFWFVAPKGGGTNLRIYAAQFTEANVGDFVANMIADNPEFEFKAVAIDSTRPKARAVK